MARILLASEFNANLGHSGQLLPLARRLRALGHDVTAALGDLSRAEPLHTLEGIAYLQAPVWRARSLRNRHPPTSYAEILERCGYEHADALLALTKAWRSLYALAQPDAIVFDHAPTALLASRGLESMRFLYGTGFCSPPRVQPLPSFREWERADASRLVSSETRVLLTINSVLRRLGLRALGALHELFDVDEEFLCSFAELDHYPQRVDARYWGAIYMCDSGLEPTWPAGERRVFVYVRRHMPIFTALRAALQGSDYSVVWACPDMEEGAVRQCSTGNVRFVPGPVRLSRIACDAQAAVLYGGHGTACAMLLAGVPLIVAPLHVEQALLARRVAASGAGVMLGSDAGEDACRRAVRLAVEQPECSASARAFSRRHADHDPVTAVARIAKHIHEHYLDAA